MFLLNRSRKLHVFWYMCTWYLLTFSLFAPISLVNMSCQKLRIPLSSSCYSSSWFHFELEEEEKETIGKSWKMEKREERKKKKKGKHLVVLADAKIFCKCWLKCTIQKTQTEVWAATAMFLCEVIRFSPYSISKHTYFFHLVCTERITR